jgi:putative phage-type endonuclease
MNTYTTHTYLNDLEDLDDVLDNIIAETYDALITEEHTLDIIESALHLMEHYIEINPHMISEEDFKEELIEEVSELFYTQWEHLDFNSDDEDDIEEVLEHAFEIFFTTFYSERSFLSVSTKEKENSSGSGNDNKIAIQLDYLRSRPQPTQRTSEWYEFRHNLITASNAYKAFESQAMMNQLIYEKCQPLKKLDENAIQPMVNVNTTFHWGQKYEPLSVMLYEYMYNTKVEDFGCIQHSTYSFLGASPDGINVDESSERYGRMLEIKNIVNREITGIPKKEYWVQMQLQMEVCDLDMCDFLETKFVEYESYNDFVNDGIKDTDKSERGELKGVMLYFNTKESRPFYVRKPLDIINYDEINEWEEEMIDKYQSSPHNMMWIKSLYWKLEKLSCVLVMRNKEWFEQHITQLENIWKIIEKERISGYEHRAPNKRIKKEKEGTSNSIYNAFGLGIGEQQGCLIKINKLQPMETETETIPPPPPPPIQCPGTNSKKTPIQTLYKEVLRIRTESIDETKDKMK